MPKPEIHKMLFAYRSLPVDAGTLVGMRLIVFVNDMATGITASRTNSPKAGQRLAG